jgi:predicted permease
MLQDVKYALRMMRSKPGFATMAVLALALGIGANAAIFSVVKQVLLKSSGMKDPDRLVMLWPRNVSRNIPQDLVSPALYQDWRAQNHSFSDLAAAADHAYTLTGAGEPESLLSWPMTSNYMKVLGVEPMLGRWFALDEEQPGRNQVAVLSYNLWRRKFGSNREIVGQTITLDAKPYTVIGVMPQFQFLGFDIWTPLAIPDRMKNSRGARVLRVVGRLKDGVTRQQAEQDLEQLSSRLGQQYPDTDKGWSVGLQTMDEINFGGIRTPLLVLMGATGLLLLLACANVANLLLARAVSRKRELAVRLALGAKTSRLVRLLMTESVVLALAGCALGVVVAYWAAGALVRLFPTAVFNQRIPHIESIQFDGWVVAFSFALAIATGVLFGVAPILQISGLAPEADLKDASARTTAGGVGRKLRPALVVAQLSVALVLMVCSGLTIKSFLRLQQTDLGFNPDHVLTMYVSLPAKRYPDDPARSRFVAEVLNRVTALPGVSSAGAINFLPLTGFWGTLPIRQPSAPEAPVEQWPSADFRMASTDYFRAMQIPLLRGRTFNDSDTAQAPPVVVVNDSFARTFFHGEDPVGKLVYSDPRVFGSKPFQVIGVIADVKHFGAAEAAHPELYRTFNQDGFPFVAFVVRSGPEPMSLANPVRQSIWGVDKDLAITRLITMEEAAAQSSALRRISMVLFAFFGAAALVLAALGVFGVMSYLVAQRTREIGIRMALGAQRGRILAMVVGQSMQVALIGLGVGVAVALGITRFLTSLLFEVAPLDLVTFSAVPLLLGMVAICATWLPARRAAAVEPTVALRYE